MTKSPDRRDARITIRLPATLKAALEREAERERRSVADTVVLLLTDTLARKRKA